MRNTVIKHLFAALALACAMAVPAAAQTSLGANVTFLSEEGDDTGAGFEVDLSGRISPELAVVCEFGLNDFEFSTITSYLGGVRYLPAVEASVNPFVHVLLGLERFTSEGFDASNGFAFQLGGGVEFPVSDSLAVRAQYDYRRTSYDGEGFNGNRFGVGVVFPLGR